MKNRSFDLKADVPQNDEQALIALEKPDEIVTANLRGLYRAHRAQGKSVLEAFRAALEAHVKAPTREGHDEA